MFLLYGLSRRAVSVSTIPSCVRPWFNKTCQFSEEKNVIFSHCRRFCHLHTIRVFLWCLYSLQGRSLLFNSGGDRLPTRLLFRPHSFQFRLHRLYANLAKSNANRGHQNYHRCYICCWKLAKKKQSDNHRSSRVIVVLRLTINSR